MPDPLDGLNDAQREAVTHPDGPALVIGGAGTGKSEALARRFAWLAAQGAPPETRARAQPVPRRAPRACAAESRSCSSRPGRSCTPPRCPSCCCAAAARRGARGRARPVLRAREPRRAAGAAARADRRPDAAHARDPRQPGAAARRLPRADRPAEERDGHRGRLRRARRGARGGDGDADDAARAHAAREAEFAGLLRRPRPAACARAAGSTAATSCCGPSRSCTSARTCGCARPSGSRTCSWTTSRTSTSPRASCCGCSARTTAASGRRATTTRGSTASGRRRGRTSGTSGASTRTRASSSCSVSHRCAGPILAAAQTVVAAGGHPRIEKELRGPADGTVSFWRCQSPRAEAQAIAAAVERLIRDGVEPDAIGVFVRSVRDDGSVLAAALEERGVPARLSGTSAYFQRLEVRDLLAWLRLLADPADSGAVVRALSRPPIELRSVDIARLTQLTRRRKLDMISGVAAACEGPQLSPEGRDRALAFLRLHRARGARVRVDAAGRVRPPADRADRHPPPAAVRLAGRHGGAAGEHLEARRPRERLRAALSAGLAARLRALPDRGRRGRAARGRGRPRRAAEHRRDRVDARRARHGGVARVRGRASTPRPCRAARAGAATACRTRCCARRSPTTAPTSTRR